MRWVGIVFTIISLFLMFSPMIALLSWIPLLGYLLGAIATFAAFIFAFVVGGCVALLTIGIAWLVFRPVLGVLLILTSVVGVCFIFFYDWGGPSGTIY